MTDHPATVFSFFTEIGILDQLAGAEINRAMAGKLNRSEFGVLTHFIRRNHAATPSYLAKSFQMAKPSMTAILAKLEAKGFVSIRPSAKDKRRKFASITQAGRHAHAEALMRLAPFMAERFAGFDMEKLDQILPILVELRERFDAARNEADGL